MVYIAGIDVGAISVKVLVISEEGVRSSAIYETGVSPKKTVAAALGAGLSSAGIQYSDLSMIVTTGHGRNKIPFSNMTKSEISSIARGARILSPGVSLVVDIGGQGIRAIKLGEDGVVDKFLNNDKCSAGTGCFLDSMAVALGVELSDLGDLSKNSASPSCMSTKCTIFAESEVVSLVARGTSKEDIIAGLHQAVAQKVSGLLRGLASEDKVLFCGGVARNSGVVTEMKKVLGDRLMIPQHPQLVTALGAAIYGLEMKGGIVE